MMRLLGEDETGADLHAEPAPHAISFSDPLITRRAEFHGLCPWVNVKAAIWYV